MAAKLTTRLSLAAPVTWNDNGIIRSDLQLLSQTIERITSRPNLFSYNDALIDKLPIKMTIYKKH